MEARVKTIMIVVASSVTSTAVCTEFAWMDVEKRFHPVRLDV